MGYSVRSRAWDKEEFKSPSRFEPIMTSPIHRSGASTAEVPGDTIMIFFFFFDEEISSFQVMYYQGSGVLSSRSLIGNDDFRSGCRNVSLCHHKQSISGPTLPGRSNFTDFRTDPKFTGRTPEGNSSAVHSSTIAVHSSALTPVSFQFISVFSRSCFQNLITTYTDFIATSGESWIALSAPLR